MPAGKQKPGTGSTMTRFLISKSDPLAMSRPIACPRLLVKTQLLGATAFPRAGTGKKKSRLPAAN